jgi:hypothetical protein
MKQQYYFLFCFCQKVTNNGLSLKRDIFNYFIQSSHDSSPYRAIMRKITKLYMLYKLSWIYKITILPSPTCTHDKRARRLKVFIHEGEVLSVALVFTLIFYMKKSPVGLPRSRVILSPISYSLKQIVELNNTQYKWILFCTQREGPCGGETAGVMLLGLKCKRFNCV